MARPLLLVIALWQFMERGKYPEVVVSCVFQLWRSHVSRGRWPGLPTDLSRKEGLEAHVPSILHSRTSAASFFGFEQLGVTPPPAGGWVPREVTEDTKPGADGRESEAHTEWWSNIKSSDWIYHSSEDKYFHVPSNTLWERRETECCDPVAGPHTYCRVDAVHLQALSHFAKAMDTALVPMVWKAWVFYTRKRTGRHVVVPPLSEASEGFSREASKDRSKRSSEKDGDELDNQPHGTGASKEMPHAGAADCSCGAASPDAAAGRGADAGEDSSEGELEQSEAELLAAASAGIGKLAPDSKALKKALTSTADTFENIAQGIPELPPHESQTEESSLLGGRPRGWCLCFRMRGRRRSRARCSTDSDPTVSLSVAMNMAASVELSKALTSEVATTNYTTSTGAGKESSASAVSSVTQEEQPEPAKPASKPSAETFDRHSRRLNLFLTEVKRNPQRLVTHVEKRRSDKTHLAFTVV